jgi:four helix bundle protein
MTYNGEDRGAEKITSFVQLRSWQHARALAGYIYKQTEKFPSSEKFGLSSQIQRSAVSVAANVAEGFSRSGSKEKANFYSMALGSLTETLSHAYIAYDLGFMPDKELKSIEEKVTDLHKMINGLIKSVQRRTP